MLSSEYVQNVFCTLLGKLSKNKLCFVQDKKNAFPSLTGFPRKLYGKLRYVSRIGYLWENVRRNEIVIPEFVYDHDEDLEYRPMMDYGLESDHARVYDTAPALDSPFTSYSMRCIS